MRNLMAIAALLMATGCATVHEICSEPDTLAHYKDYDQCYAEKSAIRKQQAQAYSNMGNRFKKASQSTQCITNYSGGYAYTTCN